MNGRDGYDIDEPEGDEFDELLAALQTYHDPERLKEYATRIPELIYAVRRARAELGEKLEAARLLAQVAEQLKDERDSYRRMLDDEREESARLRYQLDDVMRAGDLAHNRNVALLERCERAEADAIALRRAIEGLMPYAPGGTPNDLPPMIYAAVAAVDDALAAEHPGDALLRELEAALTLIADLRVGAKQQSQSHADVLAKIADYDKARKQ